LGEEIASSLHTAEGLLGTPFFLRWRRRKDGLIGGEALGMASTVAGGFTALVAKRGR